MRADLENISYFDRFYKLTASRLSFESERCSSLRVEDSIGGKLKKADILL